MSLHATLKQTTVSIASDTDGATSVSFEADSTAVMVSNGTLYLKLKVETTAKLQPKGSLLRCVCIDPQFSFLAVDPQFSFFAGVIPM